MNLFNDDEVNGKSQEYSRRDRKIEEEVGKQHWRAINYKQSQNPNGGAPQIYMLRFAQRSHRGMVFQVPTREEIAGKVQEKPVIGIFKQACPQQPHNKACKPSPRPDGEINT